METPHTPALGDETWEYYGSCAELVRAGATELVDEYFFPNFKNGSKVKVRMAARICHFCPVAIRCLQESFNEEVGGVWAGLTPADRARITDDAA